MVDKKAQPTTACRIRRDRLQVELGALIVEVTFPVGERSFLVAARVVRCAGIRVDACLLSPEGTTSRREEFPRKRRRPKYGCWYTS
jgi:hypothetical protein